MEMDRGKQISLLAGLGLGAAVAFFLDAGRGGRRRALVRDKAVKVPKKSRRNLRGRAEDAANRAGGIAAEARAMADETEPTDHQLAARVRAELGHNVEHAKAIRVVADDGRVTLRGVALREELDDVLNTVRSVSGVRKVNNELEVHDTPGRISALQN